MLQHIHSYLDDHHHATRERRHSDKFQKFLVETIKDTETMRIMMKPMREIKKQELI